MTHEIRALVRRVLRIKQPAEHDRELVATEVRALAEASRELDYERQKMHLVLTAMAEQLRATYGE